MYSSGVTGENYLRGVQVSDADGGVSFSTIVPGCYDGRWPHIHFEVYRSATTATSFSNKLRTSQLALPQAMCSEVYTQAAYTGSASNLGRTSLGSDKRLQRRQHAATGHRQRQQQQRLYRQPAGGHIGLRRLPG